MPQAMWKGSITFGLVTVPVALYPAREIHAGPQLHQVHHKDGGRIRQKRYCEEEGEEVPYRDIARGYEAPDGSMVVLTEEDLEELPLPSKRVIDVLAFLDQDKIDPIRFDTAYYVGLADKQPGKPYHLLRDAMAESGQLAVAKVTISTRESLAVLRVSSDGKTMILQTMKWPDEIREPTGIRAPGKGEVRAQELKMAKSLMDRMSEDFDLDSLRDEYTQAMQEIIDNKLEGTPIPEHAEPRSGAGDIVDLMDALRASVDATRSGGKPSTEDKVEEPRAGSAAERAARAKKAAKKAPSRRRAS